ncbi:MAG: hypothetical protein P4M06_23980 [Pandoraea sp.]|nr:hypothetical protein [Pandoraea sp.]MDR3400615.1 hypothetical protein [Pandoraea sp.]
MSRDLAAKGTLGLWPLVPMRGRWPQGFTNHVIALPLPLPVHEARAFDRHWRARIALAGCGMAIG